MGRRKGKRYSGGGTAAEGQRQRDSGNPDTNPPNSVNLTQLVSTRIHGYRIHGYRHISPSSDSELVCCHIHGFRRVKWMVCQPAEWTDLF